MPWVTGRQARRRPVWDRSGSTHQARMPIIWRPRHLHGGCDKTSCPAASITAAARSAQSNAAQRPQIKPCRSVSWLMRFARAALR